MADISQIKSLDGSTTYDIKAISLKSKGRVSSANINAWADDYKSKITTMLASSSMDSSGTKPPTGDGYIINFGWDSTAGWGSQIAISHTQTPHMAIRGANGGTQASTWGNWYTLLDSGNYTTYTVSKDGTGATGTWGIGISGNAATATTAGKFTSAQSVTLTGDVTGTASSQAGWSIATTLASVTRTNNTSTASPAHGATFTAIDSITTDAKGRVTAVNTKTVTLPADSNTDTKVTQSAPITTNGAYYLLHSKSANTTAETDTVYKANGITFNPNTYELIVTSNDDKKGRISLVSPSYNFGFLNGSDGINHGIYDSKASKWALVANDAHVWRLKGTAEQVEFLTSPTAAGTAAKTVTVAEGGPHNFSLLKGTSIYIQFTNQNTANNPTLNISGTGAKAIYYKGARVIYGGLATNIIYHMIYDGTQWQVMDDIEPTYGTCTTAAGTAAKTVTCPGFVLYNGAIAYVKFNNTNTHATPTLNINSTGAKSIIYHGATTTHAYKLRAEMTYIFRYNGSQYELLGDYYHHPFTRGVSAVAATYYTQQEYDDYVATNGEPPTWSVGDEKTAAVAATTGYESLYLGNSTTSTTNNGMTGRIGFYGAGSGYHLIQTALTGSTNRTMYIPNYGGDGYFTHTANANAVGSTSQPVYVAANGRITAITGDIANNTTGSAAKLTTAREIYVALGSVRNTSSKITFDGSADKAIHVSGTLGVANGGTGATSFTANSVVMSGSSTTAALTTRAVTNNTSNTAITNNNTNIPTMNTIYYGLVGVNGASQSRATTIYAPTTVGTSGQYLMSNGSGAPTWSSITTTDEKVNVSARGTTKAYLLATTTSPTNTKQAVESVAETGVYLDTTAAQLVATTFKGALDGIAAVASKLGTANLGSTTKPIYLVSGTATECSTYAGGTAVTLNNASKAASTASFYAPTTGGTQNTQALVGDGATTAPKWVNISPSISITAGTSSATPKVNVTVLGQSGTAQALTTASTSVYGCTKLSSTASTTEESLAATPKGVQAAINTLDVASVGGGTGQYISAISETDGKISATVSTTSVSNAWTAGTTAGPQLSTTVNDITGAAATIPSAGAGASGIVTTTAQQFDGDKTFKGNIYPQANNTYSIGSVSLGWKDVTLSEQSTANANGIQFSSGSAIGARIGANTSGGIGIYGSGGIYLRPAISSTGDIGMVINTDKTIVPGADSTHSFGTSSLHWQHGYFDDLFVSTNTTYTATNSAAAGTAITTGQIDITAAAPKIQLHRATAAAVTGTISSETDYGIQLSGVASATGAGVYITGTAPTTGITYTSRTIKPILQINGTAYSNANIETAGYFMNNTAGGNNTGYYTYGNNIQYGRQYIGTIGKAGTATTFTNPDDETQTVTGYTGATTGTCILELGNNKAAGTNGTGYSSPGTAGTANNARGYLRLYGWGTNYTDLLAQANGNRTCYLPNYAGTMYLVHASSNSAVGSATVPVYVAANGRVTACTAGSVFSAMSWTAGTTAGPTLSITVAGQTRTAVIPSASGSASGVVTTGAQTFAGVKTFSNTTDSTSTTTGAVIISGGLGVAKTVYGNKIWGAVWNDYAEFRITKEKIEPGRCIRELGDDTLELTTERLQKGCEIVSDTFGFAIGQSEKAKTPTAASGRVLAYLYEDREIAKQHIGDPVCSGPNGTVSIMTEEEEMRYPSRIIGTISAVPDYEIWNAGSEETPKEIKVNGRIWIRIR